MDRVKAFSRLNIKRGISVLIQFKKISWKNFLSTGNNWTKIELDSCRSSLVVGTNGSGKSTMIDALSFGLFGKPHRNIKKDQLVNTINGKQAEIVVEFDIGSHSFKVIRGIKPNKFEIWDNGTLLNQSANTRDYQKYLEQSILKLNHKSFHQIVVLGSSSFVPFMQLPAGQRREVIEDLLDIQIFSKMNSILKDQLSKLKDEIKDIEYQIQLTKEKITLQQKYIRDITEMNDEQIQKKRDSIAAHSSEIAALQARNTALTEYIQERSEGLDDSIQKLSSKREKVLSYKAKFEQQVSTVVKEAKFYEENDACPTCTQVIDTDLKEEKLDSARTRSRELKEALDQAESKSSELDSRLNELRDLSQKVSESNNELYSNNKEIDRLQSEITQLEEAISDIRSEGGDLSQANGELQSLKDEKETLTDRKLQLVNSQNYKTAAAEMLKDSGIKTKIVKEYLPAINQLVNKYLQTMDFFVSFHLDETFTETIKSRHRDSFSYSSFSEGEKARINLSLIFTWRQIARMKNSASTNLLVMDEVMDSSVDDDGVEALQKILSTLGDDTNVFIVSHRDELKSNTMFDRTITFSKHHNFSEMEVST